MTTFTRQPFAPLDGARLQTLTSLKNRQNGTWISGGEAVVDRRANLFLPGLLEREAIPRRDTQADTNLAQLSLLPPSSARPPK